MAGNLIDGKSVAASVLESLREDLAELGVSPTLGVILANSNPASLAYVKKKIEACHRIGAKCQVWDYDRREEWLKTNPYDWGVETNYRSKTQFVRHMLEQFGWNPSYTGLIVQMPVEGCENPSDIFDRLPESQDVDCFSPENFGMVMQGNPNARFEPCTPAGIIRLLEAYDVPIKSANYVIINNSNIVGKPLAMMLSNRYATVSVCHRYTSPATIKSLCNRADVIVVAVGQPGFLGEQHLRNFPVVIDVGINRRKDGEIVGDLDPACLDMCRLVTPVPGGVGPMTVAMLMKNLVKAV